MENEFEKIESPQEELKRLTKEFLMEYVSDKENEKNDSVDIRIEMVNAISKLDSAESTKDIAKIISPFRDQIKEVVNEKNIEKNPYEKLLDYLG